MTSNPGRSTVYLPYSAYLFLAYLRKEKQKSTAQDEIILYEYIVPRRMYRLVSCAFRGDPENVLYRMSIEKDATKHLFTLHEVWKDYLPTNSPVTPKPEGNAIILDAPSSVDTGAWSRLSIRFGKQVKNHNDICH